LKREKVYKKANIRVKFGETTTIDEQKCLRRSRSRFSTTDGKWR
jgi:hypothetical protein